MVLRFVLSWALCFLVSALSAQGVELRGVVLDSLSGEGIEQAMIYVVADSSQGYLGYAASREGGFFSLHLDSSALDRELILNIRHLKYEFKRIRLSGDLLWSDLRFYLNPTTYVLPDVVLMEEMPAVQQRGDTTLYEVSEFIDSTEYNVEDILKKLPGVEVGPDGSIKVHGKPIDKLLIEGSDLFGRQYVMGTRSIRARYIAEVEVIEHFQDNPVMSGVNTSESIALNLKFKEEVKNVVSGSFHGGLGVNTLKEGVGFLRYNAFYISRKKKLVVLGDHGNSISHYSSRELDLRYGSFGVQGLKERSFQVPDFQFFPDTRSMPGLPSVFIDNSVRHFVTLRSEVNMGARWRVQLNGVYTYRFDEQRGNARERFLSESYGYELFRNTFISSRASLYSGNVQWRYLSKGLKSSFEGYFNWEGRLRRGFEEIREIQKGLENLYSLKMSEGSEVKHVSALYTSKVSDRSVIRFFFRGEDFGLPQTLRTENRDLPGLFGLSSSAVFLDQSLSYAYANADVRGSYILALDRSALSLELGYGKSQSVFDNRLFLEDSIGDKFLLYPHLMFPDTVVSELMYSQALMNLLLENGSNLRLKLGVSRSVFSLNRALSDVGKGGFAPFFEVNWERKFYRKSSHTLRLSYRYGESQRRGEDYFSIPYFRGGYTLELQGVRDKRDVRHDFRLSYMLNKALKDYSFSVNAGYVFDARRWLTSSDFVGTIVVNAPYYALPSSRFYISSKFQQFILGIKTWVGVRPSFFISTGNYEIEGTRVSASTGSLSLKAWLRGTWFSFFNVSLESEMSTKRNLIESEGVGLKMVKNTFSITYRRADWLASFEVHSSHWRSSGLSFGFVGAKSSFSKTLKLGKKEGRLELLVVNVFGAREYESVWRSDLFDYTTSIESVPLYFVLSFDYSL